MNINQPNSFQIVNLNCGIKSRLTKGILHLGNTSYKFDTNLLGFKLFDKLDIDLLEFCIVIPLRILIALTGLNA